MQIFTSCFRNNKISISIFGMTSSNNPEHDLNSLPQWAQELIRQLTCQVQQLTIRVRELEAQVAKNSSNSGKPPSSDGLAKPDKTNSLRGKSGKKPGGQPGRIGKTLNPVEKPNKIVLHTPVKCTGCQTSLNSIAPISEEKRQVFDIPPLSVVVTEHRAQTKICPCCGAKNKGEFPGDVNAFVQYGERVKALTAYFLHQHLIPVERTSQIFEDIFNIPISPGTCANMDKKLFKNLQAFEESLKAHLISSKVLHFDETGVRCEKKLHWIHVASSEAATFFGLHANRGGKATDDMGILPEFKGTAVHDHWQCYFSYKQVKHGLCNVHHLRELKFVYEEERSVWAKEMTDLLIKAKKIADKAKEEAKTSLALEDISLVENEYKCILVKAGIAYLDSIEDECVQEGVGKQGCNLFRRLLNKMEEVLLFMKDLSVPFSNNLAEQDLRMEKVKQKISGCFRTFSGGVISCRVRSYISTARKQGWNIIDSLAEAICGAPRMVYA
jgi:transposase